MAWKKGAVVIKKAGDEEWANEMEKVLDIRKAADQEKAELERENTFMKRHIVEDLESKIIDAEINYGYNFIPPKWLGKVIGIYGLFVYCVDRFADKYLRY